MIDNKKRIAVIRIRGTVDVSKRVEDTFKKLRLFKRNTCVVVDNRKDYIGMLNKVKDYSTWGEIDQETFKELLLKRGRVAGNKLVDNKYIQAQSKTDVESFVKDFFSFKKEIKDVPGLKSFFRLGMPRKGFERKGIKVPFSLGGALGYRKEKINELIKRMA